MTDRIKCTALLIMAPLLLGLASCNSSTDEPDAAADAAKTAGQLVLRVESAVTAAEGRNCVLGVQASNNTGAAALNVQAAWMAQTEGFGIISDYQILGDFAADEVRSLRLGIVGAPCNAVRDLELTRAVCVVGPAQNPPQSCADLVTLIGGGVVTVR